MIFFDQDGNVTIAHFESAAAFNADEEGCGGVITEVVYTLKMPSTAAGDALLRMCDIGIREEEGFEILLQNILGEAFRAGMAHAKQ